MNEKQQSSLQRPGALLWVFALPQVLGIWASASLVVPQSGHTQSLLIAIWGVMGLCTLGASVYAVAKRQRTSIPQPLLLALLAQSILTFGAIMLITYGLPRPTHIFNLEVVLLLLAGIQAAGLSLLLYMQRYEHAVAFKKADIGYGFLIPLACAISFNLWSSINLLTDFMLSAGIGLFCLGALFGYRWIYSYVKPADDRQQHTAPQDDSKSTDKRVARKKMCERPILISIFAIVFPVLGLALNRAVDYIAFDTSHPIFYVLAITNGLLMLYYAKKRHATLAQMYIQSIGYSYIIYFAVLFVPVMHFGLLLSLVGIGFLILTPAVVLLLEGQQLYNIGKTLRKGHSSAVVVSAMVLGLVTIPVALSGQALIDRANYNKALAVIQSDVAAAKPESVNRTRLIRTINNMNDEYGSLGNGASRIWILDGRTIGGAWGAQDLPFIDQLYASIVYGQLPLGVAEIEKLNETFFRGSESVPRMYAWGIQQEKYNLVAHDVRTQFDAENGVYKSWVDLQIQYTGGSGRRSSVFFDSRLPSSREFSAEFDFPEGNFITDYYLYVGHENKQGILSEKRAAQLIYKQIVNRAQDPGIVSYSGDGKISLKVFPFADGEIRKTGFQVMHIEPLVLNILGQEISLDCAAQNNAVHVSGDMEGHSLRCTAESCTSILPLTGNAYDDAMVLRHNTKVQPEPIERVKESFEQRVLTDRTTFIVLESAQQEQQLRLLQQRILNGEDLPEQFVSMSEPSEWLMLIIVVGILILIARKKQVSGVS